MASIAIPVPEGKDASAAAVEFNVRRKRFTRAEVDRLEAIGFFAGARFELINGDLVDKMGQIPPHAGGVSKLAKLLARIFPSVTIRTQAPVEVSAADAAISLPEPDVVVPNHPGDFLDRHPRADETVLVVEVSDSTIRQDTITKRALYARAGVPEYWVLDITGRKLLVYLDAANGDFQKSFELDETGTVPHSAEAGVPTRIASLLP